MMNTNTGSMRILRKIFGVKQDIILKELKRLHNFHVLYPSNDVISVMKSKQFQWDSNAARIGITISVYGVLLGKSTLNCRSHIHLIESSYIRTTGTHSKVATSVRTEVT